MTDSVTKEIWSPSTGITDLEIDPTELASSEIPGIKAVWRDQRERLKGTDLISKFTERLSREWAIETGIIENLYDIERGVTQTLIDHGFRAEFLTQGSTNRPREFVLQLLNDQKHSLEGVFDFVKSERPLSSSFIKALHEALLRSQTVTQGIDTLNRTIQVPLIKGAWKTQPNHPVRDGVTYKYCPPQQVASEMDKLVETHAEHIAKQIPTEVQAAWLHHRFTQIHPFQDGNGRVARAITSSILVKDGLFPLVVTRDHRKIYLDALEAADEGELKPLVDLVVRLQRTRFSKAAAISETVLSGQADVKASLDGLLKAASKSAVKRKQELERVFAIADCLKQNLRERLDSITPEVRNAMLRVASSGSAWVSVGSEPTSHYYRSQVFENARKHLDYFVNFSEYRSWVGLNMQWERRARLVFAIHGIGHQFSGSLICAPFLEFQDNDGDDESRYTLVPVSHEGFIFFFNETTEVVVTRFQPWRDRVLQVALRELTQNL